MSKGAGGGAGGGGEMAFSDHVAATGLNPSGKIGIETQKGQAVLVQWQGKYPNGTKVVVPLSKVLPSGATISIPGEGSGKIYHSGKDGRYVGVGEGETSLGHSLISDLLSGNATIKK